MAYRLSFFKQMVRYVSCLSTITGSSIDFLAMDREDKLGGNLLLKRIALVVHLIKWEMRIMAP